LKLAKIGMSAWKKVSKISVLVRLLGT